MFFALDENNRRIHIDNAIVSESYFCPCCGRKMVLRMGDIRIHHFAHPSDGFCKDSWHYDMSDWHFAWQNRFPKECQEVVKVKDGQKHRADVLIESEKTVFEFQHSPLSPTEFEDRNTFYNSLGYKVVWIFDVEEQYENNQLDNYISNLWSWKRPKSTFERFDYRNKQVQVYLQLSSTSIDLVKVTWCTEDKGLSRFATDGYSYDENAITHIIEVDKKRSDRSECKLSDLSDKMIQLEHRDHMTYFFGCPISSTHKCASTNIDIPDSKYQEIMPCTECKYLKSYSPYDPYSNTPICQKRFLDLELDGDAIIRVESKDGNGFINKISFVKDGSRTYIEMPTFKQEFSKDIYTLWEENHCSVAVFRNIRTGIYIRVYKDPMQQKRRYGKVYGVFSKDKSRFPKTSSELFGVDKPEWVLGWHK